MKSERLIGWTCLPHSNPPHLTSPSPFIPPNHASPLQLSLSGSQPNRYPPYFMAPCVLSDAPKERQEVLELYLLFTLPQSSCSFPFFPHLLLFPQPVFLKCDLGRWQRLVRGGPSTFEKRGTLISPIHHCLLRSAMGSLQGAAELKGSGRCRERKKRE